uniref:Uncharacterized protein n=1 Tax=Aegilops tauschii subsp. strangulata TaxID=200361 RepID=A0A453BCA0_AEGTS
MMKWTHAAGAAETLCEPWVLHRFVRACPWSHEHLSLLVAGPGEQRQLDPGGAPLWDPLRPMRLKKIQWLPTVTTTTKTGPASGTVDALSLR